MTLKVKVQLGGACLWLKFESYMVRVTNKTIQKPATHSTLKQKLSPVLSWLILILARSQWTNSHTHTKP